MFKDWESVISPQSQDQARDSVTLADLTAGAGLFWWGGKMLRQVVWILPSHILPFQTVGLHDFGKILTICSQFCLPGKIIRSPQCLAFMCSFQIWQVWRDGLRSFWSLLLPPLYLSSIPSRNHNLLGKNFSNIQGTKTKKRPFLEYFMTKSRNYILLQVLFQTALLRFCYGC